MLAAESPEAWRLTLRTQGSSEGGPELPICIEAQCGNEAGQPTWRAMLWRKPPGLLGRLRGRGDACTLQ